MSSNDDEISASASTLSADDEAQQKAREAAEAEHQRKIDVARSKTVSKSGMSPTPSEKIAEAVSLPDESSADADETTVDPAESKAERAAQLKAEEELFEAVRKAEEEKLEAETKAKEEADAQKLAEQERERKIEKARKDAEELAAKQAEEARLEQERKEEEARKIAEAKAEAERKEAERIAELARIEAERIAEEERIERERIAEEERIEAARIAELERIERERIAEEERIERERIARVEERARRIAACGAREIKSTPPDFKVIVRASEKDVETDDYELWYHSDVMAEHSQYFDNLIHDFREQAVPTPWEIRMDDFTFDDWELMVRFLDPLQSRNMTAEHVLQVSEYYDQYDFPVGRELCDVVLTEYFLKQDDFGLDVHLVVDAIAVAYKAHLHKAYETGNPLLKRALVGLQEKLMKTEQTMAEQKAQSNRDRDIVSQASPVSTKTSTGNKHKFPGAKFFKGKK